MTNKVSLPPISDILYSKSPVEAFQSQPAFPPLMPLRQYYSPSPMYHAQEPVVGSIHGGVGNYTTHGYSGIAPVGAPHASRYESFSPAASGYSRGSYDSSFSASDRSQKSSISSTSSQSDAEPASPKAEEQANTGNRPRTRNNLPKETTMILLNWLNDHLNHPYPNSFEKTQLVMSTGLNQQQLSNWFINARRRKIKALRQRPKCGANKTLLPNN